VFKGIDGLLFRGFAMLLEEHHVDGEFTEKSEESGMQ
jgi:hypothetical protein